MNNSDLITSLMRRAEALSEFGSYGLDWALMREAATALALTTASTVSAPVELDVTHVDAGAGEPNR